MDTTLQLRPGLPGDLEKLQKLFVDTINTVCARDYDIEQRRVWSASVENKERWNAILSEQYIVIAEIDSKITGFASSKDNYLDMLFVHKDYQRLGIAKQLYYNIEQKMLEEGHRVLTVHASKTALPFFEAVGCIVVMEKTWPLKNVMITNYIMEKEISFKKI